MTVVKRRQPRTSLAAPVRVWTQDQSGNPTMIVACTLDASQSGLRLCTESLQTGQVVAVQYGTTRSRFRVVWTDGHQAGLASVDGKMLFRHLRELPADADEAYMRLRPVGAVG